MRSLRPLLLLSCAAYCLLLPLSQASAVNDIAVIVNKRSAQSTITSRDLRSVLLGQLDKWPDGHAMLTALPPFERPETIAALKTICGMSPADFKRYFMQLTFQGKTVTLPRILPSPAAVKAFVARTPGALGIVPASSVDSSVDSISIGDNLRGTHGGKAALR